MTLRQLHLAMDGNELQEWEVYAALEPWGEDRQDLRFARLTAFLYNSFKGKSQPELSAADFMPDYLSDPDEKVSQDGGEGAFLQLAQLTGAEMMDSDMSDEDIETYLLQDREWGESNSSPQKYSDDSDESEG